MLSNRYINIKTLIFHLLARRCDLIIRLLSGTPFSNEKQQILPQLNTMKYSDLIIDKNTITNYEKIKSNRMQIQVNKDKDKSLSAFINIIHNHCIFFNKEDFNMQKEFYYSTEVIKLRPEEAEILGSVSVILDQMHLMKMKNMYEESKIKDSGTKEQIFRLTNHTAFIDKHALSGGCYPESIREKIIEYYDNYSKVDEFLRESKKYFIRRQWTDEIGQKFELILLGSSNIRINEKKYHNLSIRYTRDYIAMIKDVVNRKPEYGALALQEKIEHLLKRDSKLILCSHYKKNIEMLIKICSEFMKVKTFTITSDKNFKDRNTTIFEFEETEGSILVASVKCFSHGLSILKCSSAAMLEICYELETLKQLCARIDRLDSENKIKKITHIINPYVDSIEELYEAQLLKAESLDELLEIIKSNNEENDDNE